MLVNITEHFIESGREWQVGQNPDVPREVAAMWIADGKATADTDGVRNQSPVSGGGDRIRIPAGSDGAPLDVFDLYSTGLPRKLTLPSPYSAVGPAMVHPSVLHVPSGWMGWRYWMAVTPYPLNDSQYENPCILVSQDGEQWETPAGLANPIVQKPTGGYNADTELALSPDGSRLYLIYRERIDGVANNVRCMESVDGVTWTAPRTIIVGAYGSQDYASPSLMWDSVAGVWRMIAHNLDGGATYPMQTLTSSGSDIYTGWSAPSAVTIANPTAGRTWWHSQFKRLPGGRIIGLVQDIANGGAGSPGALFVAESLDSGSNFSVAVMYSDLSHYRCALAMRDSEVGASVAAFIGRFGAGSVFSVWREDWLQGAADRRRGTVGAEYALTGAMPSSVLWFDNFNRADGALGTPVVGSALTVGAGTMTIASGRATTGSAGNNRALVSVGRANYTVDVKFSAASATAIWLIVRAVDGSNFWRIGVGGGLPATLYRERIAAGSSAALVAITGPVNASTAAAEDVVRVACRGRRMRVYVNGVMWAEWEDTVLFSTGVQIGLQGTNAGVAFDDLLCIA